MYKGYSLTLIFRVEQLNHLLSFENIFSLMINLDIVSTCLQCTQGTGVSSDRPTTFCGIVSVLAPDFILCGNDL